MSEQTPIPAAVIDAVTADLNRALGVRIVHRDSVADALANAAPALLAAGRAAAAEDPLVAELVRAAQVWRAQFEKPAESKLPRMAALIAAVDALAAARVAEEVDR